MKSGVIYDSRERVSGVVYVGRIIKFLKSAAWSLRKIGAVFMGVGILGLSFIYLPLVAAEAKYATSLKNRPIPTSTQAPMPSVTPTPTAIPTPAWEVPDPAYSVYIPKIEAISRVIPSVNAADPKEYMAALKLGVAEAADLSHPGELGTTFLFAHSVGNRLDFARYNAVFYLLDKLEIGDGVEVVYQDKLLKYEIVRREILPATNVQYLVPQKELEQLVLQTCYPPGTSWKRLVVVAKRVL